MLADLNSRRFQRLVLGSALLILRSRHLAVACALTSWHNPKNIPDDVATSPIMSNSGF